MFFQKYKKIIIILAVAIIIFLVYAFMSGSEPQGSESLLTSSNQQQNQSTQSRIVGNEIVAALNQIETLKLSRDIFDDPVFRSLVDRSQPLPNEPVGKTNPFSPIGSEVAPRQRSTTTPNVNTIINTTSRPPADPAANQPAI